MNAAAEHGMKVVVVTPNPADSALASRFIEDAGIATQTCATLDQVIPLINADTGCIVVVEEALDEFAVASFHAALRAQPPWSDLPLLLIGARSSSPWTLVETLFPVSGNVTLLQRPIHPASLVSAVSVALRARARQLEVRDLLEQRDRAVRQRDEFLAMLAHELRNPLNPIRTSAYMLRQLDINDDIFVSCRNMIDKQVRHITRLVDDLLDVSRLELGKIELRLEPMDLSHSVTSAVEACEAAIRARGQTVSVRLPSEHVPLTADPVRLEQAICNLIVNAVKFTPEGGRIEVEAARDHDMATIAVSDNGAGIQPHMLESIFDLFTQDSVTLARSKGGLGIGLTLVRRLVQLHGGTVNAFSGGPGKGSRFVLRLPMAAQAVQGLPQGVDDAPEMSPKRVLVIDDGVDTRKSLGMLLARWKHEVLFAETGPEGLERARESQPDVAIIDIGLPGIDGYEVAQRIRGEQSSWSRQVRLIALTGYGQPSDRERALVAGFDVHMLKPVDPRELRALLA